MKKLLPLLFLFVVIGCAPEKYNEKNTSTEQSLGQKLQITNVMAQVEAQPTSVNIDSCIGANNIEYTLTRIKFTGPITSDDSRLNGVFFGDAKLLHAPDGSGVSRDDFYVVDPETGNLKLKGTAHAADPPIGEPIKGFARARIIGGGRFFAASTVFLPAPGTNDPLIVQYGTASNHVTDYARIIDGHCFRLLQ